MPIDNVRIRPLENNDYTGLSVFMSNFPDDKRSPDEWLKRLKFWWDNNPNYTSGHIRGVVLLSESIIVGFTGNIPSKMLWDGKEEIVISGTSWRVLPEFRKYSMDLWFAHRDLTKEFIYFNTTPIGSVQKLLEKSGYHKYAFPEERVYYFIGDFAGLNLSPALKILLKLYMFAIYNRERLANAVKGKAAISIIQPAKITDEIDVLWSKTKTNFSYTNFRDRVNVEWYSRNKLIYYIYHNSVLTGFFILLKNEDGIILTDLWGNEIANYYFKVLCFIINSYGRSHKIMIPVFHDYMTVQNRRFGLISKKSTGSTYFIYDKNRHGFEKNKCYLTLLQGDFGV